MSLFTAQFPELAFNLVLCDIKHTVVLKAWVCQICSLCDFMRNHCFDQQSPENIKIHNAARLQVIEDISEMKYGSDLLIC